MESCDSLHHFSGESLFVRIICINSRLLINTESRYSLYSLLRRATTPCLIHSGSRCWQWRVIYKNIEGLPFPFKGQWSKKDYPSRVLLTKNIFKRVKIGVDCGSIFDFPLSWTAWSRFFGNLSTNNSAKIWQISKLLLGMSFKTRISRLMKKLK
jgi:hypothetical protein